MDTDFKRSLFEIHKNTNTIPSPQKTTEWVNRLLGILFPEMSEDKFTLYGDLDAAIHKNELLLSELLRPIESRIEPDIPSCCESFYQALPKIHELLLLDADAITQGDPAAVNQTEVLRTYPGFYAIAIYRIAHVFYKLRVPLIPRILTEIAHTRSGIDIHPAAEIGKRCCIDHGTGVVIGGTTIIGEHVKIYQGVTLGALSVQKELASTKRHPTIEDDVVIYSGATILGGDTIIGKNSIIGGNVWLTSSVPPNSRVYYKGAVAQHRSTQSS